MDPNDPESHKNEGFLKSMWHNLTNHPAHQDKPESASKDAMKDKTDEKKADEKKTDADKKASDADKS